MATPFSMAFSLSKIKPKSRHAILSRCLPILGFSNGWRRAISFASVSGVTKEALLNWAGPRGLFWSREKNHQHMHTEVIKTKTFNQFLVNKKGNKLGLNSGQPNNTIRKTNPIDHKNLLSNPDREERPKLIEKRTAGIGPNGIIDLPLTFNITGKRSKGINHEKQAGFSLMIMPFMRASFRRKTWMNSQHPIIRDASDESDESNQNEPLTVLRKQADILPDERNQKIKDRKSERNWPGPFKKNMKNTMTNISGSLNDKMDKRFNETVTRHVKQIYKELSINRENTTKAITAKEVVTDDVVRLILQKASSFMEKERFRLGILK